MTETECKGVEDHKVCMGHSPSPCCLTIRHKSPLNILAARFAAS